MKILKKLLLLLLLPSCMTLAASDPVAFSITQNFPSTILVPGGTYVASVVFTNRLPFTNFLSISKISNAADEFSYQDSCSNVPLAYSQSCIVTIYLNPTTLGDKYVQLIESYGKNRVHLPMLFTHAIDSLANTQIASQVTTALPATLEIGESAPWKMTFTNSGADAATGVNIAVSGSNFNTNCNSSLSGSCYVQGNFTASKTGTHTIAVKFTHTKGDGVAANTATTVQGGNGGLICNAAQPFAPVTLINASTPITLLCVNKSGSSLTIDSHVTSYPSGGADGSFTPSMGGDNCTAQTIANNAACQLSGTYTAPASAQNNVLISLLVNYHTASVNGLSASTSTATDVVTTINNTRNFNLVNQCDFPVWWSMVGGAITDSPACTSNNDCPSGSTCNVAAKLCYYNNYGPTAGSYQLTANGGAATTSIVETDASTVVDEILWKGVISASTQCSGSSCLNNDCQNNGGTTSCAPGVGFQQPATEAEFTLQLTGASNVDSYDISNVNGFSIPISMASNQAADDYNCGTAGSHIASGNLKACDFSNVTPPTNMYYWVENTGTACTNTNTCSNSAQICGLAFNKSTNGFEKNCGKFLGYWAANQICQTDGNFTSPFGDNFNCSQVLSNPFPASTYTLTQLLKCSPPDASAPLFNSCYLNYSGQSSNALKQCCGCSNWSGIATPSSACPAGQTDPQWNTYVEPIVRWMKKACPTSYSYPYDDKASSFSCTASQATEYTITFCPGGGSGLPNGKLEGR